MARAKPAARRTKKPPGQRPKLGGASSSQSRRVSRANAGNAERGEAKSQEGNATPRKPHRFRPGTVALREIRKYQKSWHLLLPAASFIRCVREITTIYSTEVTRWTAEALVCIQEAAEDFLVHLFEDTVLCAVHAKRVTIYVEKEKIASRYDGAVANMMTMSEERREFLIAVILYQDMGMMVDQRVFFQYLPTAYYNEERFGVGTTNWWDQTVALGMYTIRGWKC